MPVKTKTAKPGKTRGKATRAAKTRKPTRKKMTREEALEWEPMSEEFIDEMVRNLMKRHGPLAQASEASELLCGSYDDDMPFTIHADLELKTAHMQGCVREDYMWSVGLRRIAESALLNGCKLSVPIPEAWAAPVIIAIVGQLNRPMSGRYDRANKRLVLWDLAPKDDV